MGGLANVLTIINLYQIIVEYLGINMNWIEKRREGNW